MHTQRDSTWAACNVTSVYFCSHIKRRTFLTIVKCVAQAEKLTDRQHKLSLLPRFVQLVFFSTATMSRATSAHRTFWIAAACIYKVDSLPAAETTVSKVLKKSKSTDTN